MSLLENFDGVIGERFIETGTNVGNTLELARTHFKSCISCEQGQAMYEQCLRRFAGCENVILSHGESPAFLREVVTDVPTTFWLDAHYFENGDTLAPSGKQCPLLDELRVITAFPWTQPHMVMIDDAYMFDDAIPHPGSVHPFWTSNESNHASYNRQHWPKIEEIDAIMQGYEKSMRENSVLQYVKR